VAVCQDNEVPYVSYRGSLDRLNTDEYEVMKTHAALGARLLSDSEAPVMKMAMVIAETHHERWDGTGYPAKLSGKEIPLVGRIVAVADVFDALTHDRPYKSAWPVDQALAEIERGDGTQFDPAVVAALLPSHADADAENILPARGVGDPQDYPTGVGS
jgi:putative two-component system response regulator